jgi:Ca-activated chloride channel family protein
VKPTLVLLLAPALFTAKAWASPFESPVYPVTQGNQSYADKKYEEALEKYESVEEQLTGEARLQFNRGDALFMLQRFKEAREAYLRATGSEDPDLKKRIYYNIGNTFLSESAFQDAIDYYRRALQLDPAFEDARFNLELALRSLKQQKDQQDKNKKDQNQKDQKKDNQQDQQDQGKQQKQDEDQKQDKKQDQKQDQKQEEKQSDQQSKQQKQNQQTPEQQNNSQPDEKQAKTEEKQPPGHLSQVQVKDLLDAARENEKPFQLYRFQLPENKLKNRKVDKDW